MKGMKRVQENVRLKCSNYQVCLFIKMTINQFLSAFRNLTLKDVLKLGNERDQTLELGDYRY